jgi:hypothetical protein
MNWYKRVVIPVLLAFCVAPAAVRAADDGTGLRAAVLAASAAVTSYRIDTTIAGAASSSGAPVTMQMTVVKPDSAASVLANGPTTILETRKIGDTMYIRLFGGEWRTTPARTAELKNAVAALIDPTAPITVLPDTVVDGVSYHAYRSTQTIALGAQPAITSTVTCYIDRATMLPAFCNGSGFAPGATMEMRFSHYNDPTLVIAKPVVDPNASPFPALPIPTMRREPNPSATPLATPAAH